LPMLILVGFGKPFLLACARRGAKPDNPDNLAIAEPTVPKSGYLLQPDIPDAIDVFDPVPHQDVTPSDIRAGSLRPASRDQIRGCAVRQHPPDRLSDEGKPSNNTRSLRHRVSPIRINLLFTM